MNRIAFAVLAGLTMSFGSEAALLAETGPWIPLFDGRSLSGWTDGKGQAAEEGAWRIDDGAIHLDPAEGKGGNLLTTGEFTNFELVFEWKIASKSNSGIKYRVQRFDGRLLGYEYQIIDDVDHGGLADKQRTASVYDIYEPLPHDRLRPVGEYNRGCIIVCGNFIEHYLNGYRVVAMRVGDADWTQRIRDSKFADVPGFGVNPSGRIMLTDHGDEVWYRNVYVRRL